MAAGRRTIQWNVGSRHDVTALNVTDSSNLVMSASVNPILQLVHNKMNFSYKLQIYINMIWPQRGNIKIQQTLDNTMQYYETHFDAYSHTIVDHPSHM